MLKLKYKCALVQMNAIRLQHLCEWCIFIGMSEMNRKFMKCQKVMTYYLCTFSNHRGFFSVFFSSFSFSSAWKRYSCFIMCAALPTLHFLFFQRHMITYTYAQRAKYQERTAHRAILRRPIIGMLVCAVATLRWREKKYTERKAEKIQTHTNLYKRMRARSKRRQKKIHNNNKKLRNPKCACVKQSRLKQRALKKRHGRMREMVDTCTIKTESTAYDHFSLRWRIEIQAMPRAQQQQPLAHKSKDNCRNTWNAHCLWFGVSVSLLWN